MMTIEPSINEYLPLRDVVFQTLRRAILQGELKPGERLMEIHLANQLGVSRTPIREAMRRLELEGLVEMIPRKGAVVASITEKNMKDVLEVRRTLELMAVELACVRISKELLEKLEAAKYDFDRSLKGDNIIETAAADMAFHEIIYQATDNPRLISILNTLREQMYRYRMEYLKDRSIYEGLLSEHTAIYNGIKDNDPKMAKEVMKTHIDNQEASILQALR